MFKAGKIVALEAIRGFAALIVVNVHMAVAFYPEYHPKAGGIAASWPASFFWNGRGAVILFFVLSGYVLTKKYFDQNDRMIIFRLALKRWPRLFFLTTSASLFSWLLLRLMPDTYWYAQDNTTKLASILADGGDPSFLSAFLEGTVFTFFRGDHYFVSPLWTMAYEFAGSFVVLGLAILVASIRASFLWHVALTAILLFISHLISPYIFAFMIGMYVSFFASRAVFTLSQASAAAVLGTGILMLTLNKGSWIPGTLEVYAIGAAGVMWAFASSEAMQKALDRGFFRWIGEISFPLYVIHYPIIGSAGWAAYQSYGAIAGAIASLSLSLAAATLLSRADKKWTSLVGKGVEKMLSLPFPYRRVPADVSR